MAQIGGKHYVRQRWLQRSPAADPTKHGSEIDREVMEAWNKGVSVGLIGREGTHRYYPPAGVVIAARDGVIKTILDASLIPDAEMNTDHLKYCASCHELISPPEHHNQCPWCGAKSPIRGDR
jgi:hypothetical protein